MRQGHGQKNEPQSEEWDMLEPTGERSDRQRNCKMQDGTALSGANASGRPGALSGELASSLSSMGEFSELKTG